MEGKSITASVKLTGWLLEKVDELVEKGVFTSRSEAIREATRLMILSQYGILKGKQKKTQLSEKKREKTFNKFLYL